MQSPDIYAEVNARKKISLSELLLICRYLIYTKMDFHLPKDISCTEARIYFVRLLYNNDALYGILGESLSSPIIMAIVYVKVCILLHLPNL